MKTALKFIFSISLFVAFSAKAQTTTTIQDSITVKENYGLRVGIDLSKPLISIFEKDYKGLELVGDFRVYKNYYATTEIGFENKTTAEDYLNFTSKGSYIKVGFNYNAYKNWVGMHNEITIGLRYAFSTFNQILNSYTPNKYGTYFDAPFTSPNTTFSNLNAQWAELIFGLKVALFKNLYLSGSVQLKSMINTKEPKNFKNLYIPGFNRVYSNNTGVGFNYTLSYLIPIYKKEK